MLDEGVERDVIELSYYPIWHGPLSGLRANLDDLAGRHDRDLVETAYPRTLENGDDLDNLITELSQVPDAKEFPPTRRVDGTTSRACAGCCSAFRTGPRPLLLRLGARVDPGRGLDPRKGNPRDNMTMFDWSGEWLPSLRAFRAPHR